MFVELPEPGATFAAGGSFGNVESVEGHQRRQGRRGQRQAVVRLPSVYNTLLYLLVFLDYGKRILVLIIHM